jgi:hypothetical protein
MKTSKETLNACEIVIPAKAGIHAFNRLLDPRFRGDDLIGVSPKRRRALAELAAPGGAQLQILPERGGPFPASAAPCTEDCSPVSGSAKRVTRSDT